MKITVSRAAVSLALCLALPSCFMTSPVSLSPSSIPLRRGEYTVVKQDVSGRAFGFSILGLPLTEPRQMAAARDRAMEQAGAQALVNITSDYSIVNLLLIQLSWTTVRGDAVKLNQ